MSKHDLKRFRFRGHWVAYIDEGQGDAMLFVHNGGQSLRLFDHQIDHFKRTNRVIAMDWLGFGASDKPRDLTYDAALYIEQINALVDYLGLKSFDLVGCCVGAGVAIMYARRNPDRVRSLTCVTIATPQRTASGMLGLFLARPGSLKQRALLWLARSPIGLRLVFPRIMKVQLGEAGLRETDYADHCAKNYADRNVAHAFMAFDYFSLAEIDTSQPDARFPPHLVIWGRDNPVLLASQGRDLARRWGTQRTLFLEGCGYGVLREASITVNEAIESKVNSRIVGETLTAC